MTEKAKKNGRWIIAVIVTFAVAQIVFLLFSGPDQQRSTELSKYLQVDPKVTEKRQETSMDLMPQNLDGFKASEYHYFYSGPSSQGFLMSDAPVTYSLLLKTKLLSKEMVAAEKQRILNDSRFQRYELASGELYADDWTVRRGILDATDDQVYDGYSSPVYFVYFPNEGSVIYCEAYYYDALEKDKAVLEVLQTLRPEVLGLQETLLER